MLHRPDQLFLHFIRILIFVHVDLIKAVPVLFRNGGRNADAVLLLPEEGEGQVLEI